MNRMSCNKVFVSKSAINLSPVCLAHNLFVLNNSIDLKEKSIFFCLVSIDLNQSFFNEGIIAYV